MGKLEQKIEEIRPALEKEYSKFELKALEATVARIEAKHGINPKYDDLNVEDMIMQFDRTYPGLYDLIIEVVETVSREQLPEVQFMFCLECARQLSR